MPVKKPSLSYTPDFMAGADIGSRLAVHICLMVAMGMMLSVTHKIDKDAVIRYSVMVPPDGDATLGTVVVPDFEGTDTKKLNVFYNCTESGHWQHKNSWDYETWNNIITGSVTHWAIAAIALLSAQALFTLYAIVTGYGQTWKGSTVTEKVENYNMQSKMKVMFAQFLAFITAIVVAVAVTHFFISIATKNHCGADKELAIGYMGNATTTSPGPDEYEYYNSLTKAQTKANMFAKCQVMNADLKHLLAKKTTTGDDYATGTKNLSLCEADVGCKGFGVTTDTNNDGYFQTKNDHPLGNTKKPHPSAAKLVSYLLNCGMEKDVTSAAAAPRKAPFDNAKECAGNVLPCNNFDAHADKLKKTLKSIRDHTRSIVWLVGISVSLLAFHIMGIGTFVRRASGFTRVMQTLNNTCMSLATLAWYSIAIGAYFLWVTGQDRKGTATAWKHCPVAMATDSGFDTIGDEERAENFYQVAYILSFVALGIGLMMSLMFRNTLTFRNNSKLKSFNAEITDYADRIVSMDLKERLVSMIVGALGAIVIIMVFTPIATQASTQCSLVRTEELGREASSYVLTIYGLGIILALSSFYTHIGFAGLTNAGLAIKFATDPKNYPTVSSRATIRYDGPDTMGGPGKLRVATKMSGNEMLLAEMQELN